MFHSHELHLRAEAILTGAFDQLGEGLTFRRWNPVCAIGYLAGGAGYLPLARDLATSHDAGADRVREVFGLDRSEISRIMTINDAAGPERRERLLETLRRACPVCVHLENARPRRVRDLIREDA